MEGAGIPSDDGDRLREAAVGNPGPVHEDQIRLDRQPAQRPEHRQVAGPVNPEPVDLLRGGEPDPDGGMGNDLREGRLPGRGRKALGIVDEDAGGKPEQDDAAGHDRAGQRAPPDFIQSGDEPLEGVMSALKPPIELKELPEVEAVFPRLRRSALQSGCLSLFSCADNRAWPGERIRA